MGRIAIGLVLALFALGTYYCNTQVNPITGKQERVSLSPAQEVALGYDAAPAMVRQMGGAVPQSSPKAQAVAIVGEQLLDASGLRQTLREKGIPWEFTFTLLDDETTVNAFALPGGPVFVTEALYDRMENVAQLAGVIGHVVERHGAERMAQQQLGQSLTQAAVVGTGDLTAAQATQFASQFLTLKYGREQEIESDSYGLRYLVDAGYDPREMVRVMEILQEASGGGGRGPGFMQTHPHPEDRIAGIEAFVREQFPDGVPANLTDGGALPK